ncbi:MAG: pyridoxal phosphate-dependent aminotransferase [Candidatus Hodarchaeales archaeon]
MKKITENLNLSLKRLKQSPDAHLIRKANDMESIIKLQGGDPDFNTPQNIVNKLIESVNLGETHYPPTHGILDLRESISKYYQKKGVTYNASDIIITPGSGVALFATLSASLNSGDEVILFEPYYMGYEPILDYLQVKKVKIPLTFDNFRLKIDLLKERITDKTKMIILCNPNNPSGTLYNHSELEAIRNISIENDLIILSDEVYIEFVWDGKKFKSIASYPEMSERTIICNSFSKTFAMTGWRLGYIMAPSWIADYLKKMPIGYRTCTFNQRAGVEALNNSWGEVSLMKKEYDKRRKYFVNRLNEVEGVECKMPEGAFYTFPKIEYEGSNLKFCEELLKEKILVRPGMLFGDNFKDHIRVPLIKPVDVLENVVVGIEKVLTKLK